MKYFFLISSILFFTLGSTFAELSENQNYQACFSEKSTFQVSPVNNTILLESKDMRIAAYQNGKELQLLSYNDAYSYIPFSTNIKQTLKQGVLNKYSFEKIDTDLTREIFIELGEYKSSDRYTLNFSYSSFSYKAQFFISDDGINYDNVGFTSVGRKGIQDFKKKYIKIQFQTINKEGEDSPRQLIEIYDLSIKRDNNILGIENLQKGNITIYKGLSCSFKGNLFLEENKRNTPIPEVPIYNIDAFLQENFLHTQKINDSDKDSIMDLYDNCKTVPNQDQKDVNQNGVGDACEFDNDEDGVPDEIDNCRNIANPDQADDDNDGIGNSCDNSIYYNPRQIDTNKNGIGDITEEKEEYLKSNDTDKDGVINSLDNCKNIANPDQADDDNDGIGNSCDNCRLFQNSDQSDIDTNGIGDICEDSDGDGIDGLIDNCINIANSDQADTDNDGIGNVCEDDDRDAILFATDNCPYKYNPGQEDFDKDGIGDLCDDTDDRFLESNKEIFILLMILVMSGFIGATYMMMKKLKK